MHHRLLRGSPAILCVLLLFCLGCSPAGGTGPTTYNRIVLDTYKPSGDGGGTLNSTYMELWSSDGMTLLTSDDSGISRPGGVSAGYAYIDYTAGLTSGDYYVLVKASFDTDVIDYAIRVLAAPSLSYAGWNVGAPTDAATDMPLAGGSGVPSSFKTMVLNDPPNDRLSRHIFTSGVNWVKLTLP